VGQLAEGLFVDLESTLAFGHPDQEICQLSLCYRAELAIFGLTLFAHFIYHHFFNISDPAFETNTKSSINFPLLPTASWFNLGSCRSLLGTVSLNNLGSSSFLSLPSVNRGFSYFGL
jgi:hypothetical protein